MTQKQIDIFKQKKIYKDASTDTNEKNLFITLSHSKNIQVYFSKSYKEYVLSFNLGAKKFIITKKKWIYFRDFIQQIDDILINQ